MSRIVVHRIFILSIVIVSTAIFLLCNADAQTETWYAQVKLLPSNQQMWDEFGSAVAIDEDTITVGAPGYALNASNVGTAYIFVRSGTSWIQQAQLLPNDANDDAIALGNRVAISGDTIAVAATLEDAVYVFSRRESGWVQQAKLLPPEPISILFADAIAIDNNTIVASDQGRVHVFKRGSDSNTWSYHSELRLLYPPDRSQFAPVVSISGNTVVVGGADTINIFAYSPITDTWRHQAELSRKGVGFGHSVAINGNKIVVGANQERTRIDTGSTGAVYLYERNPNTETWELEARLAPTGIRRPSDPLNRLFSPYGFGSSVAISEDTVVVSALNTSAFFSSAESAAFLFKQKAGSGAWFQQAKLLAEEGRYVSLTSISISKSDVVVGGPNGVYIINVQNRSH